MWACALKDLESIARVGYYIPVPDLHLVLHGLQCEKNTLGLLFYCILFDPTWKSTPNLPQMKQTLSQNAKMMVCGEKLTRNNTLPSDMDTWDLWHRTIKVWILTADD